MKFYIISCSNNNSIIEAGKFKIIFRIDSPAAVSSYINSTLGIYNISGLVDGGGAAAAVGENLTRHKVE